VAKAKAVCIANLNPIGFVIASLGLDLSVTAKIDLPEVALRDIYIDIVASTVERLLYIKGGFVDEIKFVSNRVGNVYQEVAISFRDYWDGLEIEAIVPFFEPIKHIRQHISKYPTGEALDDALTRTVIYD